VNEIYITDNWICCEFTSNEVAKIVLTYMISSAFGNLKKGVKFVPVNKIKGTEITEITKQIINFVQDCGFEALCV
jgi:hypothetical protein